MNQLQQGFRPGEWYVMDRTKKVAIIKLVTMRSGRKVLRAVTWHERPEERQLLAYVGERDMRLLVEIVWSEWGRQNPPISNRK
jgi:hypothetical protein